jgi:hypothetical protein
MLIGLGYKARVGKDTVGDILVDKYGFTKVSFAQALKDLAIRIDPVIFQPAAVNVGSGHGRLAHLVRTDGWENAKRYPEVRRYLQETGVGMRELFGDDVWVELLSKRLPWDNNRDAIEGFHVITDMRFPNEAAFVQMAQGKLVRIDRPNLPPMVGATHISEVALDDFTEWDYVLDNNQGIVQLEKKVADMLIDLARKQPAVDDDSEVMGDAGGD